MTRQRLLGGGSSACTWLPTQPCLLVTAVALCTCLPLTPTAVAPPNQTQIWTTSKQPGLTPNRMMCWRRWPRRWRATKRWLLSWRQRSAAASTALERTATAPTTRGRRRRGTGRSTADGSTAPAPAVRRRLRSTALLAAAAKSGELVHAGTGGPSGTQGQLFGAANGGASSGAGFEGAGLSMQLSAHLAAHGFAQPTRVQQQAIPVLLVRA